MSNKLTHISLFSGIGGFDLAAHWAGFQNIAHCEWNPFGQQVLNHYFPESHSYADITKTDFSQYRNQITVLTGGFPCQPFSLAGKRGGSTDDRYLWPEMLRAIREIRPTWVIGENVFGITTMVQPGTPTAVGSQASIFEESNPIYEEQREFVIETICSDLEREGYSVQPIVVPACAVGAPHRRDRIWFIAHRDDGQRSEPHQEIQAGGGTAHNGTSSDCANTRSENMQQGRENRVCEGRNVAYTDGTGLEETRTEQQTTGITRGCTLRSSSYSECGRSNEVHQNVQSKQSNGARLNSVSRKRNASYTESKQSPSEFEQLQNSTEEKREFRGSCSESNKERRISFESFPTQPPVYPRNDGIPRELVGRSFPPNKWREESVKACGNAIVPQVAYQFFEMIKQIQKK